MKKSYGVLSELPKYEDMTPEERELAQAMWEFMQACPTYDEEDDDDEIDPT